MYSRNYYSQENYPILPPGYSGVALQKYAHFNNNQQDARNISDSPRRPIFEDTEYTEKIADESCDNELDLPQEEEKKPKKSVDAENSSKSSKSSKEIGKSSNDDILLAGIIILLLGEGKCDELTLFLLGFLLLG